MSPIARLFARSLGGRLFLLSGSLVLGTMLAALGFTVVRAQQESRQWVRKTLESSAAAQERVESRRAAELRLVTRVVANDPAFVAYVAEADPLSVRDLLIERLREVECDLMVVVDRNGRLMARTDRTGGPDLGASALVARVLERGEATGLLSDGERVWTAAAVPIVVGGEALQGILMAGLAINDGLALDVARASGAEVAYVDLGASPRVIASTVGEDRELLRALIGPKVRAARGRVGEPLRLNAGGRTWAVQITPLGGPAAGGDRTATVSAPSATTTPGPGAEMSVVTLASLDQVLGPFRRIEGALVVVGLVSLAGAFALSYALSRRITRPLEQLADAADAARGGRYDQPLPTSGQDEVGRVARAFRGLLAELREEREVEAYVGALSRSLPDTVATPRGDGRALAPGARLGERFEILGCLGAGGFGVVYKARDRQLNDVVALKTLHASGDIEAGLEGLKNELRIARRITHRNVLRTHDFGEAEGVAFISMEYVAGITVRELLDHARRPPASVALRLGRQLAGGIEAAHELGVIHGDIKPENLIVDATGQLKIMDFGIARMVRRKQPIEEGTVWGTPGYLAPEQLQGDPGDVRSDVYGCGAVLYELFAGRRPFLAANLFELSFRVMNEDPPELIAAAPDLAVDLASIVMRCLARDPGARFASARELRHALEATVA